MRLIDCNKCVHVNCLFRDENTENNYLKQFKTKKEEHIFKKNDLVKGLYILQNGEIVEFYNPNEPETHIEKGKCFGFKDFGGTHHNYAAKANLPSTICFLSKEDLTLLKFQNPKLIIHLMDFFLAKLSKTDKKTI